MGFDLVFTLVARKCSNTETHIGREEGHGHSMQTKEAEFSRLNRFELRFESCCVNDHSTVVNVVCSWEGFFCWVAG